MGGGGRQPEFTQEILDQLWATYSDILSRRKHVKEDQDVCSVSVSVLQGPNLIAL